jgi:glucans biosynthesis protein C
VSSEITAKPRLYYLDWLRVLSMLAIFLYHNNRFYNYSDWHVKNAQLTLSSTIFESILGVFLMPLLFTLSGAAIYCSLRSRTAGQFARERFLRLMVPVLTIGIFVFGPFQIYLERFSHGDFTGTFWQFIPHYFDGFYGFGGNFAWMGVHLWYLLILFLFSILFLPLFIPFWKGAQSALSRLSSWFSSPWAIFLMFVPLAFAPHLTDALGMGFTRQMGGWDTFSYMLFLIYGYLLVANPKAIEILRKYSYISLGLAILLAAFVLVLIYTILPTPDTGFFFSTEIRPLISFLFVLGFLGMGNRYLNFNNKFVRYSNEAVLPFYILHQPVILSIGFFVVQWTLPIIVKYLIVASISFIVIMLVYEFVVKRLNVFRFLFGMKPRKRLKDPVVAPADN